MNLKNYTSSVPAMQSISYIEKLLIDAGATNINKSIGDDKEINSITFQIGVEGKLINFKLPAKVDLVFNRLWKNVTRPNETKRANCMAQAKRTAWKILFDWVSIQVSMIQINQVELMEVFLPYAYDSAKNETYYERLKRTNYNSLQIANGNKNENIEDAEIVD